MKIAKIDSDNVLWVGLTDCLSDEVCARLISDGYKTLYEDTTEPEISGFESLKLCHREEMERIVTYYEVQPNDPQKISAEIERLKTALSSTDYKIIKSYEYSLAGEASPYNITDLHHQRQELRDKISELEIIKLPSLKAEEC